MNAIQHTRADWERSARGSASADVWQRLIPHDDLYRAIESDGVTTLHDLVARMTLKRSEAYVVASKLLRDGNVHPMVQRALVQAMIPGLFAVAKRLRWGDKGEWQNRDDFIGDLVATLWEVVIDWTGQDRPYAAPDLLSAVRCRLRRRLVKERDVRASLSGGDILVTIQGSTDTDLDCAARLIERYRGSVITDAEADTLYLTTVLGVRVADQARLLDRDRRTITRRLDTAREKIVR